MSGPYDDIIDHPHYQSKTRPHMSMLNRAAQFSPFAALTGYDDAVEETQRLTDERIELDPSVVEEINRKLSEIAANIASKPYVTIVYFVRDMLKAGGAYLPVTGCVVKFDEYERVILMEDGTRIPIEDIFSINAGEM
ncbi:MAG: hypothetical protein IJ796_04280 [Lachnospiraceae bacterium]|nr:hypothetical protein [Lachnospiraceae bacterium]